MKNLIISSGIEPVIIQFVAQCLNELRTPIKNLKQNQNINLGFMKGIELDVDASRCAQISVV